jgi:hypothetical protein
MKFEIDKLAKFPLLPNSKLPACKWTDKTNHIFDKQDKNKNYGLLTGKINNLLVLDIDVKDNGLEEWKKYVQRKGEPKTITITTPSGGFHYYFLYHSSNHADEQLLRNYLHTQTKLRNAGLDIRSDGGYVVGPNSKINHKTYTYVNHSDKDQLQEIPTDLLLWLLEGYTKEGETKKEPTPQKTQKDLQKDLVSLVSDEKIIELLQLLPNEFCDNYLKWLSVTNVLKGLNKQDLWNTFSRKSKKYNRSNNINIWNQLNSFLDINYIIHILNSTISEKTMKIELIESYKPFQPLTVHSDDVKLKEFHHAYVSDGLSFQELHENSTIVIESCTGTGKTTATAKHCKELLGQKGHLRVLSLVNKISLADQHVTSFNEQAFRWSVMRKNLYTDHLVVCINSLRILNDLPVEVLKNQVVYIDEVNSFLESLTHNETLVNDVRTIFLTLAKIIKCAHKVILSDALINDAIKYLLEWRYECYPQKALFVRNTFKKYQDIKAIHVKNEEEFLQELLSACKTEKGFLFGCDGKSIITDYYNKCFSEATAEEQKKFLLITADSKRKIEDASTEFKGKFVFYSPSITTGVDFSIGESQKVYIYVNGKSILSNSIFQQTTRTRNIKTLFYYCSNASHKIKYSNVEAVETHYADIINLNSKAFQYLCVQVNENDQQMVIKNTFFKLFCYNEYVKDVYQSNIKIHFKQLLQQNGFVLSSVGEKKKLEKIVKGQMKELTGEVQEASFEHFINDSESNKTKAKYKAFTDRSKILHLNCNDKEELTLYSAVICKMKRTSKVISIFVDSCKVMTI